MSEFHIPLRLVRVQFSRKLLLKRLVAFNFLERGLKHMVFFIFAMLSPLKMDK